MTQIIANNNGGGGGGSSNVTGPNGAVDENIVIFDGNTGKAIKDSGMDLNQKQNTLTAGTDLEINTTPGGNVTVTDNNVLTLPGAKQNSLISVKAYGDTKQGAGLPAGYTELGCIQNVGGSTRYNTGIIPQQGDIIEIKFRANSGSLYLVQSRIGTSGDLYGIGGAQTNSTIAGYVNNYSTVLPNIDRQNTGDVIYVRFSFDNGATEIYGKNETQGIESTKTGTYTRASTTRAYRVWSNSAQTYAYTSGIFFVRITNGRTGNLRMNWIPAQYNGVTSFYDTVSESFITKETGSSPTKLYDTPTPQAPQDIICNNGIIKTPLLTDGTVETIEDELGNTATAEMLLSAGNYVDTQEILTGAITRNIGCKILRKEDVVEYQSTYQRFVISAGAISTLGTRLTPIHCTHFQTIDDGRAVAGVPDMSIYGASTENLYIHYSAYNNITNFGNWLDAQFNNGTPVIVVYPLNTPTTETVEGQTLNVQNGDNEIQITQASISPLQLDAVYEKKEVNTINFTNDSGYITIDDVPVYTAGTGISINDYEISATGGGGNGDVVGPNSSTDGNLAVFDGTTGKLIKDGGAVPVVPTIVDNLTTQSATSTLSANQGYVLKGMIDDLMGQGRFLSLWNCATGLPISFPLSTPYTYLTGDYFMVETLDTVGDPATNYRPTGSSYSGTASSTAETGEVKVGDYYVYDGTVWLLASNHGKDVTFSNIAGQPSDNANLSTALNGKQNNRYEVTVSTAYNTAAKVGTTTAGNYTPTKGDFLLVNFVNGCSVASPTLKIDNSSAIAIRTGNAAVTTGTLALGDTSNSNIKALFYYDGTYYRCWSTTNSNTTYSAMSVSEGQTGTATTARTMRADRLPSIIQYHSVDDTAYANSWDGVTNKAPSKNAVYDKIESLNLPIISASAPATPTEGMIWYDTTNDKLKTYDGSNWNECGSGGGGGSGDVTGPNSSTDGNVVLFDGATGKIIKDSGIALSSKQDALTTQTAYTSKGTATKVPQITTNTLGQVTNISEVTITQPTKTSDLVNDSGFITAETVVSGDSGTTYTIKVANSDPTSGTPATTITFVL